MTERFEPLSFEWDVAKATSNEAKYGVPFDYAIAVFLDPARLEETDARQEYGEERTNVIGQIDGRCHTLTYTLRNGVARIISARKAHWKERLRYERRT